MVVVVNPVARNAREAQDLVCAEAHRLGWPAPLVLPTTVAEPGGSQARRARREGADIVVVIGGDGTVRQVAHELAGTPVALAVVPLGTANLFARNLRLAPRPLAASVHVALHGERARVDLGSASLTTRHGRQEESFLVLTGIGHDALTVHRVPAVLKRRVGWLAYLGPAARTMLHRPTAMTLHRDADSARQVEAWSVLVVNCGRLPGGLRITHGSIADDGVLENLVVTASTARHWAGIAAKGIFDLRGAVAGLRQQPVTSLVVEPRHRQPVQLDGDVVQGVSRLQVGVRPRALTLVVAPRGPSRGRGR
ncbi:MAG TPA: diacylglycerol kinase family protein [Propionibacteriaceae bacterium]|nr:diacylglycerol kinase family protein [Propionibacteriaceae bacterium]